MDDDLNSPMVISALFDWVRIDQPAGRRLADDTAADLAALTATVRRYVRHPGPARREGRRDGFRGRDYVTPLVEMLWTNA